MRFFRFCGIVISVFISASLLFVASLMKNPYGSLWARGERMDREYYLCSPSSQAKICGSICLAEYCLLEGERSSFLFQSEQEAAFQAAQLLKESRARLVRVEEVEGARSYYAYSETLGDGVALFGEVVNLHVVQSGRIVRVGTPLIFGGY